MEMELRPTEPPVKATNHLVQEGITCCACRAWQGAWARGRGPWPSGSAGGSRRRASSPRRMRRSSAGDAAVGWPQAGRRWPASAHGQPQNLGLSGVQRVLVEFSNPRCLVAGWALIIGMQGQAVK